MYSGTDTLGKRSGLQLPVYDYIIIVDPNFNARGPAEHIKAAYCVDLNAETQRHQYTHKLSMQLIRAFQACAIFVVITTTPVLGEYLPL